MQHPVPESQSYDQDAQARCQQQSEVAAFAAQAIHVAHVAIDGSEVVPVARLFQQGDALFIVKMGAGPSVLQIEAYRNAFLAGMENTNFYGFALFSPRTI